MTTRTTRTTTTARTVSTIATTRIFFALSCSLAFGMLLAGCGPDFDPASLVETTRVLAARVEIDGAPDRASPRPGETATVTWLVTSPQATPPLAWAFAVCEPGPSLGCGSAPLALVSGTDWPPRLSIVVPPLDALGSTKRLMVYGEICSGADAVPAFDPQHGVPSCIQGDGTAASLSVPLQLGDDVNHNPTADRAFTFDGQPWPALPPGGDPCLAGPRVAAGSPDHLLGDLTAGSDREAYTASVGDPPVPTPHAGALQISQFTTAGKLKTQFSFVEATDSAATTTVDVTWEAPRSRRPGAGRPVTFTFVTRDNRGGTDWTTRQVCVNR